MKILIEDQEKCLLLAVPELRNDDRPIQLKTILILRERGLVVFGDGGG